MHKKNKQIEELVLTYQTRMRAYLFSRTGDMNVALDLTQDTFLVLFKEIHKFDNSREAWPWLAGIANNLLHEHWRSIKKQAISYDVEHFLSQHQLALDREANLNTIKESRIEALHKCVKKLPETGASLVQLIYEKKLKCAEVAEKLGMNINAVKTAIHRIRKSLEKCINSQLKEER